MPKKLEDIELRSEEVQDILTKIPHWMIRFGSGLFLILTLMLFGISWVVKYPDIIIANAIITTEVAPQRIYAKVTGKLSTILVQDRQEVIPNQTLAILENTSNYKDVIMLKSIMDTTKINKKYFIFPIDSLPIMFLGDIETDFSLFDNNYIQYKLNKELQPFITEEGANKYTLIQLQKQLESLESQKKINAFEMSIKEKDLNRNKHLFEKGIISTVVYENKQLDYFKAERNFKNINMLIFQIKDNISNAKETSRGAVINRTKREIVLLKSVIHSFNQLKSSIKNWELRYVLKSNIIGKVSFLNYWSENQTVSLGDLVFTVIPAESSAFIAKLKTPQQNSGKIRVGQIVNIKLENYPEPEYGVLKGKVKRISLIPDKEGFYLIDVALPNKLVTTYNKELVFKQEMRGVGEIITEDLRLTQRVFHSFRELLDK